MKHFFISGVCLLFIFLTTNCTPKVPEQISDNVETEFYKKLAENMCACTKGLIDILKEQKKLSREDKVKMKAEFDERIKTGAEKSEFCIARLQEENSGGIREIKQDLSEAALKDYCPDFYYMSKIGKIK
ncbi:MAG: hypothetical protein ACI94Y_002018 [Maribacter sp.]|jgi:hypothetical protein